MPTANASLRASDPSAETVAAPPPSKPQETGKASLIKSKEPEPSDPATPSVTESAPAAEETTPPTTPSGDPPPSDHHWGDGHWGGDGGATPPAKVRGSWQDIPGAVVAECEGWKISLIGSTANSGFHVEAISWQRALRAVFQNQDGSRQETVVFGKCIDGTPNFLAHTGDGTGDPGNNAGQ